MNVPGGGYSDIFITSEGKTKLVVYIYDFMIYPYTYKTNIYSLPGVPVSSTDDRQSIILKNAYPNPSSSVVNIPYQIGHNIGAATLVITDMNGKVVRSIQIGNTLGQVQVNTDGLKAGTYIYFIKSPQFRTEGKKIIIE